MDPQSLVKLLNSFLSFATDQILRVDGTVDKYIGDAIVAFWNAPMDQQNHAVRTAKAAIAIRDGMGQFDQLAIGIGLHTGEALVGNIGSLNRLSYTAIGDTVNTASRLEGVTKMYGVPIVTSQSFYEEVNTIEPLAAVFRKLDTVILKGKSTPVNIYELIGISPPRDLKIQKKIDYYEKGLAFYIRGAFRDAGKIFSHAILQDDPPSHVLFARCQQYINHPPVSWNGVTELVNK